MELRLKTLASAAGTWLAPTTAWEISFVAIDVFVAFLAAAFILMLIPGPSVMLAVGISLAHGFRIGFANVCGAVSAVAAQVLVLALGLTPVLLFAAQWFEAIRWAGVAYLLYLGFTQLVRSRRASSPALPDSPRDASAVRAFWHGFGVSALNPKSLLFFAAILPQFMETTRGTGAQLAIMGCTLVGCALVTTTLWAYFADRARRVLRTHRALVWRDRVSGLVMVAGAVLLAATRR